MAKRKTKSEFRTGVGEVVNDPKLSEAQFNKWDKVRESLSSAKDRLVRGKRELEYLDKEIKLAQLLSENWGLKKKIYSFTIKDLEQEIKHKEEEFKSCVRQLESEMGVEIAGKGIDPLSRRIMDV